MKMFNKNRCYNGGNKHKFVPRYIERERKTTPGLSIERIFPNDLRKILTLNIYVYDICEWCGKTIKKDN